MSGESPDLYSVEMLWWANYPKNLNQLKQHCNKELTEIPTQ